VHSGGTKQQLETPDFDGTSMRGLAQTAGVAELELSSACKHCPLFTGRFREQLGGRDPHIPRRSGRDPGSLGSLDSRDLLGVALRLAWFVQSTLTTP